MPSRFLMRAALVVAGLTVLVGADGRAPLPVDASRVQASPHNLTHWHDGDALADSTVERQLCRVCHGPRVHEQLVPLWDRRLPRGPFELGAHLDDDEPGFPADPGSQLCLACHDGSVARAFPTDPAAHISREIDLGERAMPALTHMNTHLFSFNPANRELVRPDSLATGMTLRGDRVRCSTCHDPHDNTKGKFLKVGAEHGEICLTCHQLEGWSHSVHANPDEALYAPMREMSCNQCHSIHATPPQPGLLLAEENSLCFRCHDATVDGPREIPSPMNLKQEFDKLFTHPVSLHTGSPFLEPDASGFVGFLAGSRENRAVRCSDCHNPHAASSRSVAGNLPPSLEGVSGISRLGMHKDVADYEYEICLKCHGFSSNTLPGQRDVAADFDLSNRSSHAVMGPGLNPEVPSLRPEWTALDQLTCSDCHGNDDPGGPAGPHGSNIEHLLRAPFNPTPYLTGERDENGLCFRCHKEGWFSSGQGWRWHKLHIERGGYSCAACHDPHGSPDQPGLLRLDRSWITPLNGVLRVERTALDQGNCTLNCHGHPHSSASY
jgi:predicted CXXCH cytochrome family protein